MKLMIASDIHGSAYYCEKLIERYKAENCDKLILLGDILYHGPRNDLPKGYAPKEVIAMLNPLKDEIIAVRGNCDAEVDQMVLEFEIMETFKEINVNGMNLFLTHGHHYNKDNVPKRCEKFVLLNGHFHIPEIKDMGNFIYINDGSVSIPKENSEHSYCTVNGSTFTLKNLDGKAFDSITI